MKTNNLYFASVVTVLFSLCLPAMAGKPGNVAEVIVISTVDGSSVLADPTIPNFGCRATSWVIITTAWTGWSLTFRLAP